MLNVLKKIQKTFWVIVVPAWAYRNATISIVSIANVFRIITALMHHLPCAINFSVLQTVLKSVLIALRTLTCYFSCPTTTRLALAISQGTTAYVSLSAALASAKPMSLFVFVNIGKLNNYPTVKLLSSKFNAFWHENIIPEVQLTFNSKGSGVITHG